MKQWLGYTGLVELAAVFFYGRCLGYGLLRSSFIFEFMFLFEKALGNVGGEGTVVFFYYIQFCRMPSFIVAFIVVGQVRRAVLVLSYFFFFILFFFTHNE